MPGRDGTGPTGQGPKAGQGRSRGTGRGFGAGSSGECVCPACGTRAPHRRGVPCSSVKCPKCGATMVRED
ncbi:MAG TPA: hypothetical protein ENN51_09710 [candidate division WOR-3 bacterium]|uniref:Ferredoxin n=1 Tax=candidate division WOR-3 bacterium TaxID=2052148 RepID=A0A7V0T7Z3_UNCW3|nr:hypothetical protein [candidate division WOR-3 bacterium]